MMLEELSKVYYAAYWGIDTTNNNERDIAGIRAVVEEFRRTFAPPFMDNVAFSGKELRDMFDDILGKEAVPGGASCHSAEHAMPETASKGEQRD